MDVQRSTDEPALSATPGEARVGPYAWGAAGAVIAAVLWFKLLSLDVFSGLPGWLVEGLAGGLIVGFACGFMSWQGRRDQAVGGVMTGAVVFCIPVAWQFLFELARS